MLKNTCDKIICLISVCIATWWRNQMETFSVLLALCEGNPPVTGGFPSLNSQCYGALIFHLICAWTNGSVNNRAAGDLRRHRAHCNEKYITEQLSKIASHPNNYFTVPWSTFEYERNDWALIIGMYRMKKCWKIRSMVSKQHVTVLIKLLLIPSWISNHMPSKVWDEITYSQTVPMKFGNG